MLRAKNISYRIDKKYLLQETSVEFEPGVFHVIMGANGAGKSTLLKLLAGEIKPSTGEIFLDDTSLNHLSKKKLATRRAVLSQHYHISFPITVKDIVMMGRYPYYSNNPSRHDQQICTRAMETMDVLEFEDRDYNSLSGGEAQKAQMSRVLAQIWESTQGEKKILFLDEPVSHLDVKYQQQLLNAAKELCKNNTTVIAILHDINLAIAFADRILFMKQGRIVNDTRQLNEVSTEIIMDVFGVKSTILYPEGHKPVVIF
jgi:iron complex transport system ATP-binding protein